MSPEDIRGARADDSKTRDRDLADKLGITEAELVAAFCGETSTRITPHPDAVIGAALQLGDVMALTRNAACVHEKVGRYENYHPGSHAAMVLGDAIDLRIFPSHWRNAFMVERDDRKSLQVFDAAGDAVHKIHLRETSNHGAWARIRAELALADQSEHLALDPRQPVEAAKTNPEKVDLLRSKWARMTDTHQFLRLTSKLKMNRLGAYRSVGEPYALRVPEDSVDRALQAAAAREVGVMIFVGNRGCIQIHSGPIRQLRAMGPWQNVMDPDFNLHLRLDKIAEVWVADKPTQRGPAISLEAFDAKGALILQIFGVGKEGHDSRKAWKDIVETFEPISAEVV